MSSVIAAIDWIVDMATTLPGWRAGEEVKALAMAVYELGPNPTIVEVGAYMGRSTVLMAGARRLHGEGRVHCVDPFDCSGDEFSVPFYLDGLVKSGATSLEDVFRANIKRFSLESIVAIHKGTSCEIAAGWRTPIDLLLLDADHSPEGARDVFENWTPFLKHSGIVVLDNTSEREYAPDARWQLSYRERTPQAAALRERLSCHRLDIRHAGRQELVPGLAIA